MEGDGSQATSGSPNDSQHDPGKMFIGGLSWQTSPDSLRDYFSKFGEIRECMVMRDPTTKRSRGFGFVTFADAASVDKVLAQPHHELDSKTIDPKVAFPRRAQPKMVTRTKKIFVGGLSANTVVEDVKQYFEQFGKEGSCHAVRRLGALADTSLDWLWIPVLVFDLLPYGFGPEKIGALKKEKKKLHLHFYLKIWNLKKKIKEKNAAFQLIV
uniref:Musashi RNA-binding protein 2b n=1 Tax=Scleropages formosus TaxID=113540 RepID=A0A8C9T4I3_SCLFO